MGPIAELPWSFSALLSLGRIRVAPPRQILHSRENGEARSSGGLPFTRQSSFTTQRMGGYIHTPVSWPGIAWGSLWWLF